MEGTGSGDAAARGGDQMTDRVSKAQQEKDRKRRQKATITVEHIDIIKDDFWNARPWLLAENH